MSDVFARRVVIEPPGDVEVNPVSMLHEPTAIEVNGGSHSILHTVERFVASNTPLLANWNQVYDFGGACGHRIGFQQAMILTIPSINEQGMYTAGAFTAWAISGDGGFGNDVQGSLYAQNCYAGAGPGAKHLRAINALELDVNCQPGSSTRYKAGLAICQVDGDAERGQVVDAAISVSNGSPGAKWESVININEEHGHWPLADDTTLWAMRSAQRRQVMRGIDWRNVTFGGPAFETDFMRFGSDGSLFLTGRMGPTFLVDGEDTYIRAGGEFRKVEVGPVDKEGYRTLRVKA